MNYIQTEEDFLNLSDQEITEIVQQVGRPKVVLLTPDATRRTGIVYKRMKPNSDNFEKELFINLSKPYTELARTMYDQGLNTLIIPGFTHGNLNRGERYSKAIINTGIKSILTEDIWLDLYKKFQVNVNYYGDFEYIKKVLNKKTYMNFIEWCEELKNITKKNKNHYIFWGFACSASQEYERIAKMSINYFKEFNKYPDRNQLIKLYYGRHLDNVDIFIRPSEVRDSDCQPPIIGGLSQFYFPIAPLTELNPNFYRRILYDFLYNRILTFSKKLYSDSDTMVDKVDVLNKYYKDNKNHIIGLGKRIGRFWVPQTDIKNPQLEE